MNDERFSHIELSLKELGKKNKPFLSSSTDYLTV